MPLYKPVVNGQLHFPGTLPPEKSPGEIFNGGLVDASTGPDGCGEKKKPLFPTGFETPRRSVRSESLY